MPSPGSGETGWTVLIPAHNEAATIRQVVEGALAHADRVTVIDDGSSDGTADALAGLPVEVVRHAENRGKGPRLAEGLERAFAAGARGVLTLDADGQHDPADIPAFLAAAREMPGALVIGDRFGDATAMPRARRASIAFGDFFISWAAGRRLRDVQCGLRLYPASVWERTCLSASDCAHFVFETAILIQAARAGIPFRRVPIRARYSGFVQRPSHYRPVMDTLLIVRAVTASIFGSGLQPRGLLIALGVVR